MSRAALPPVPPGCRCRYIEHGDVRRYTRLAADCPWHNRKPS